MENRKKIHTIESLDDLKDERARAIAHKYKLDVREILSGYLELQEELIVNNGEINVDMDNPDIPLNVVDRYIKKLACRAILSYEFTQREAIQFPVVERVRIIDANGGVLSLNDANGGVLSLNTKIENEFYRIAPASVYEKIGQDHEEVINSLDKYRRTSLKKILDEDEGEKHSDSYNRNEFIQHYKNLQEINE